MAPGTESGWYEPPSITMLRTPSASTRNTAACTRYETASAALTEPASLRRSSSRRLSATTEGGRRVVAMSRSPALVERVEREREVDRDAIASKLGRERRKAGALDRAERGPVPRDVTARPAELHVGHVAVLEDGEAHGRGEGLGRPRVARVVRM